VDEKSGSGTRPFDWDRFNALMMIHDAHRRRFENRQTYEWKVCLAVWSALGLLAGSVATGRAQIALTPTRQYIGLGLLVLIVGVFIFLWQYGLARRFNSDRRQEKRALDKAMKLLDPSFKPKPISNDCFLWQFSSTTQIVITLCLAGLVILAFLAKAQGPEL